MTIFMRAEIIPFGEDVLRRIVQNAQGIIKANLGASENAIAKANPRQQRKLEQAREFLFLVDRTQAIRMAKLLTQLNCRTEIAPDMAGQADIPNAVHAVIKILFNPISIREIADIPAEQNIHIVEDIDACAHAREAA